MIKLIRELACNLDYLNEPGKSGLCIELYQSNRQGLAEPLIFFRRAVFAC